ncbi:hypothetical protein BJ742DRAFT_769222 [Cladochytrium replicatum]|nr:hypothetical protein BJ742DRAFT_769222 [Cladochytrium replicatum]
MLSNASDLENSLSVDAATTVSCNQTTINHLLSTIDALRSVSQPDVMDQGLIAAQCSDLTPAYEKSETLKTLAASSELFPHPQPVDRSTHTSSHAEKINMIFESNANQMLSLLCDTESDPLMCDNEHHLAQNTVAISNIASAQSCDSFASVFPTDFDAAQEAALALASMWAIPGNQPMESNKLTGSQSLTLGSVRPAGMLDPSGIHGDEIATSEAEFQGVNTEINMDTNSFPGFIYVADICSRDLTTVSRKRRCGGRRAKIPGVGQSTKPNLRIDTKIVNISPPSSAGSPHGDPSSRLPHSLIATPRGQHEMHRSEPDTGTLSGENILRLPVSTKAEDHALRETRFRMTVAAINEVVLNKKYKRKSQSLEAYFKEQWNMSRAQVYRFVDCGIVLKQLDGLERTPTRERICRSLKRVAKSAHDMRTLWTTVLNRAGGNPESVSSALINSEWEELSSCGKVSGLSDTPRQGFGFAYHTPTSATTGFPIAVSAEEIAGVKMTDERIEEARRSFIADRSSGSVPKQSPVTPIKRKSLRNRPRRSTVGEENDDGDEDDEADYERPKTRRRRSNRGSAKTLEEHREPDRADANQHGIRAVTDMDYTEAENQAMSFTSELVEGRTEATDGHFGGEEFPAPLGYPTDETREESEQGLMLLIAATAADMNFQSASLDVPPPSPSPMSTSRRISHFRSNAWWSLTPVSACSVADHTTVGELPIADHTSVGGLATEEQVMQQVFQGDQSMNTGQSSQAWCLKDLLQPSRPVNPTPPAPFANADQDFILSESGPKTLLEHVDTCLSSLDEIFKMGYVLQPFVNGRWVELPVVHWRFSPLFSLLSEMHGATAPVPPEPTPMPIPGQGGVQTMWDRFGQPEYFPHQQNQNTRFGLRESTEDISVPQLSPLKDWNPVSTGSAEIGAGPSISKARVDSTQVNFSSLDPNGFHGYQLERPSLLSAGFSSNSQQPTASSANTAELLFYSGSNFSTISEVATITNAAYTPAAAPRSVQNNTDALSRSQMRYF